MIILPISAGIACTLSLGSKVLHKVITNKHNKYKNQYERDQQTDKSFNKLYRNSLQDDVIDENEFESLCNIFTNMLMKQKINRFYKHEHRSKYKLF